MVAVIKIIPLNDKASQTSLLNLVSREIHSSSYAYIKSKSGSQVSYPSR